VTEEQFRIWMDAYGDAFERQDPDAAARLFEWWNAREEPRG